MAMRATSVRLPEKLFERFNEYIKNDPLRPSQRQVITQAVMEFLDNHENDQSPVDKEKLEKIADLKRRIATLEET